MAAKLSTASHNYAKLINFSTYDLFDAITSFTPDEMTRQIASDHYKILFCDAENHMRVVPGHPFIVNVVAIRQLNGTTPATILCECSC